MPFERQIPRTLDEEHRSQLHALEQLERALARADLAALPALAPALLRQIDSDTTRHFAFEEHELFTRLREAGDEAIAALLAEEHEDIRTLGAEIRPLLHALCEYALPPPDFVLFKRLALEWVERAVSHIQKETMALLPMLDELLDEQTDAELALAYANA